MRYIFLFCLFCLLAPCLPAQITVPELKTWLALPKTMEEVEALKEVELRVDRSGRMGQKRLGPTPDSLVSWIDGREFVSRIYRRILIWKVSSYFLDEGLEGKRYTLFLVAPCLSGEVSIPELEKYFLSPVTEELRDNRRRLMIKVDSLRWVEKLHKAGHSAELVSWADGREFVSKLCFVPGIWEWKMVSYFRDEETLEERLKADTAACRFDDYDRFFLPKPKNQKEAGGSEEPFNTDVTTCVFPYMRELISPTWIYWEEAFRTSFSPETFSRLQEAGKSYMSDLCYEAICNQDGDILSLKILTDPDSWLCIPHEELVQLNRAIRKRIVCGIKPDKDFPPCFYIKTNRLKPTKKAF